MAHLNTLAAASRYRRLAAGWRGLAQVAETDATRDAANTLAGAYDRLADLAERGDYPGFAPAKLSTSGQ